MDLHTDGQRSSTQKQSVTNFASKWTNAHEAKGNELHKAVSSNNKRR